MSLGKANPCPLCGADPIYAATLPNKDAYEVECRRCGKFKVAGTLYSSSGIPSGLRPWLSAYTRQGHEEGKETEMLVSSNINSLAQETQRLLPKDRLEKLLQVLLRRTVHVGSPVQFSSEWDYPLANAQNAQEADYHLVELKKKGLIEFYTMGHVVVTHDGWAHQSLAASTPTAESTRTNVEMRKEAKQWDVFICHASEDKPTVVEPLAKALEGKGLRVWYDRSVLTIGDSLRRTIDEGLKRSQFGVVILSPAFFTKKWPQWELDGLVQREIAGSKVILPVWHNVAHGDVARYSLPLADKVAGSTASGIAALAEELIRAIRPLDKSKVPVEPSSSKEAAARLPILPAHREHDIAMFRKLDHIASESVINDLLNSKIYRSDFRLEDDHLLVDFIDQLQRVENRYLDDELRNQAEHLFINLGALLTIVRRTFFSIGEGRLKFYPDLIDSKAYDKEWDHLLKAIESAWNAYKRFRLTVKERLLV